MIGSTGLKKIVVLIDADNAELYKLKSIFDEISAYGRIIIKRAYGDWSSPLLKNWGGELNKLAVQPMQQFAYTVGKNATDIAMIIDAMDLLYTDKFDSFVLVSSDSDFTSLASRLRTAEMYVYGVGKETTPQPFRNACDEFIFTENLGLTDKETYPAPEIKTESKTENKIAVVRSHQPSAVKQDKKSSTKPATIKNMQEVFNLLDTASEKHAEEDGWVNLGEAGSFIKRAKPDFDCRTFGVKKLSDLIVKYPTRYETRKNIGAGTSNTISYRSKK